MFLTGWPLSCKRGKSGKVRESEKRLKQSGNLREKRKVREKLGNLNRLSKHESFTIPYVQSDDFRVYQNTIPRDQENFSEVRESLGRRKSTKSGHPVRAYSIKS